MAEDSPKNEIDTLSIVLHDLKGPIINARNSASILRRMLNADLIDKNEVRQLLKDLEFSLNHCSTMIDRNRYFLSNKGEIATIMKPFTLRELVDDSLEIIRQSAQSRGIVFITRTNSSLQRKNRRGKVPYGDIDLLRLALGNLLENAVKYTILNKSSENCPSSTIILELIENKESYKVSVTNIGKEIYGEMRQRIFDAYFRDESKNTFLRRSGTGIGLPLVKQTILSHDPRDGSIHCSSKPLPGERHAAENVFSFELPYTPGDQG